LLATSACRRRGDHPQKSRDYLTLSENYMSNGNDMAFPVLDRTQTPNDTTQLGLTKREYFALHLTAASIAAAGPEGSGSWGAYAADGVNAADALMRELDRPPLPAA
jgi:hypothetical protein